MGATPLHYAALSGDLYVFEAGTFQKVLEGISSPVTTVNAHIFEALVLAGADASIKDSMQKTAIAILPCFQCCLSSKKSCGRSLPLFSRLTYHGGLRILDCLEDTVGRFLYQ